MKKILISVYLVIAAVYSADAAVIFSDDFSTFSIGTTWNGGYDALNWNTTSTPNRNLSSDGNQLNMQSNGGYGQPFAISTGSISTPLSQFGDLTLTTKFTPLGGWLCPLEFDVVGAAGYARFFAYRWGSWNSDCTGFQQEISSLGLWSTGTNYYATLNITNTGSIITITDGLSTIYSRQYGFTRVDAGDSIQLQLRQLTTGDESNPSSNIDYITLSGMAIPEPSTYLLLSTAIFGLFRRRRK